MANYFNLKNDQILNPPANTSLGSNTGSYSNVYIENTLVLGNVTVTEASIGAPKVSSIDYPDNDTAANPAGGQTITLNGSGFLTGASVLIDGVAVSVVSVVSSTQITFTSPVKSAGSYILYVINTDGSTAISIPGIQYSGTPTWTTPAGTLGTVYETANVNSTLVATGDAPITYALQSGTLPPGSTLTSNGILSGTTQATASSTTYTFTIRATDNELQDTDRIFSLTISPDVVTWVNPTQGATVEVTADTPTTLTLSATSAVGANVSYTANALPTGLSLSGNTISGTPTVTGNTSTSLTATATTTRSTNNVINWVVNVGGDPQFKYVTTLLSPQLTTLPFNDDASLNNFAVTIAGDTKPNNFGPYTPGYYSNYFDGTGDFLSVPSNSALTLGTSDHTIEFWMYLAGGQSAYATQWKYSSGSTQQATNDYYFQASSAGGATFNLLLGAGGSWAVNISNGSSYTAALNKWIHIAITRSGNTFRLFANGTQVGSSATYSGSIAAQSGAMLIGQDGSSNFMTGSISNFRVTVGQALYTANFTPPTEPLTAVTGTSLLTCQSNRFIDNSINNFAITRNGDTRISGFDPFVPATEFLGRGSTYFDGTGDFLSIPSNSALELGSGDYTIEGWWYFTDTSNQALVSKYTGSGGYVVQYQSNNLRMVFNTGAPGSDVVYPFAWTPVANSWYHVAITRSGTSGRAFINGVQIGTTTTFTTLNAGTSTPLQIGSTQTVTELTRGYVSNFRLVIGTALYTANFTPPTAPLTAIENTSLLTCQTNQPANNNVFIDNSTNNFLITRNGNATQGTFSPYGENWSNYFDGTGDYLSLPSNAAFAFGTGDFTTECWVYLTKTSYTRLWYFSSDSDNIDLNSSSVTGKIGYYNGSTLVESSTLMTLNTWAHIALVRSSGTAKVYLNGSLVITQATTPNSTTRSLSIGGNVNGDSLNGYISNFRVVKGTAVYTANFTPSTTPLQAIAGTSLLTCQSPSLVDDSANNFAITKNGDVSVQKFGPFAGTTLPTPYYSAYFDGNGDYLTLTPNSSFAFGTGDFTVECWYYPTAAVTSEYLIDNRNAGQLTTWVFTYNWTGSNSGTLYWYNGSAALAQSSGSTTTNAWNHIVYVRSGSTGSMYINGTRVATQTDSTNYNNTPLSSTIGNRYTNTSGDQYVKGYLSNMAVVKGTASYDPTLTTITVPTSPLTAISGTSLLTCQSNTFIDNSTNNFAITVAGNSQPRTVSPFTVSYSTKQSYTPAVYGGSMYFDGTGDYVTVSTLTPAVSLAAGNWTFECWFYASATKTFAQIIGNRSAATGSTAYVPIAVSYESATIKLYSSSNGSSWNLVNAGTIGTVSLQTWNHVAIVRNGNNLEGYLNGIKVTLSTGLSGISFTATNLFYASGAVDPFSGYVSDVRLVSGTALYTANFVPQNQPLTPVTNTTLLVNGTSAGIYDSNISNNWETVGDAKVSTAVIKYGNSSMYFDGSGDYLTLSNKVLIGAGDFTIEGWFWLGGIGDTYYNAFSSGVFGIRYANNGFANRLQISYDMNTLGSIYSCVIQSGNNAFVWAHIAWTRAGGVNKLFFNGNQQNLGTGVNPSTYPVSSFTNSSTPAAGGTIGSGWLGYIQDFRITNGHARYTSNFTPPTVRLPTK